MDRSLPVEHLEREVFESSDRDAMWVILIITMESSKGRIYLPSWIFEAYDTSV